MKRKNKNIIGDSYIPTLLRNPPKPGSVKRKKIMYYVGGKLRKKGKLGTFYHGPFLNEITALEVIGEKNWFIHKVTKKSKYKTIWRWDTNKWYRQ